MTNCQENFESPPGQCPHVKIKSKQAPRGLFRGLMVCEELTIFGMTLYGTVTIEKQMEKQDVDGSESNRWAKWGGNLRTLDAPHGNFMPPSHKTCMLLEVFLKNSSIQVHTTCVINFFYSNIKGQWNEIFVGGACNVTITDESSKKSG